MAKVTNTTPIPTEHTFEVSLTDQEIKRNTEIAARLYMHRREIASLLGLGRFDNSLDEMLALVFAMDPKDPLDEVDEVDDGFLFMVEASRL